MWSSTVRTLERRTEGKGVDMTLVDHRPHGHRQHSDRQHSDRQHSDRQLVEWFADCPRPVPSATGVPTRFRAHRPTPLRPTAAAMSTRPTTAPMRYRGTGIAISCAPHPPRRVSNSATVALAGLAALITLWLGSLAQYSGERSAAPSPTSDQLAVVQVQPGETLQQLAERVAPGAPAVEMAERIRNLNKLGSAAVDAGKTLIAPVG